MTLRWTRTRPERVEPGEYVLYLVDEWGPAALPTIARETIGLPLSPAKFCVIRVEPPESDWDVIARLFSYSSHGARTINADGIEEGRAALRRLRAKHEEKSA